jgi:hypothetical protein
MSNDDDLLSDDKLIKTRKFMFGFIKSTILVSLVLAGLRVQMAPNNTTVSLPNAVLLIWGMNLNVNPLISRSNSSRY